MSDEERLEVIRTCLKNFFHGVNDKDEDLGRLFYFNDDKKIRWQLKFNPFFIEDCKLDQLQPFIEGEIIPTVQDNPGMRIEVGQDRKITVTKMNS